MFIRLSSFNKNLTENSKSTPVSRFPSATKSISLRNNIGLFMKNIYRPLSLKDEDPGIECPIEVYRIISFSFLENRTCVKKKKIQIIAASLPWFGLRQLKTIRSVPYFTYYRQLTQKNARLRIGVRKKK